MASYRHDPTFTSRQVASVHSACCVHVLLSMACARPCLPVSFKGIVLCLLLRGIPASCSPNLCGSWPLSMLFANCIVSRVSSVRCFSFLQGRSTCTAAANTSIMAPKLNASQLFQLYKNDKLIVHTMPTNLIDKRPEHMADKTSMMCGSIMFYGGLEHHKQKHMPNAVARFGPDSQDTLFATLHSLDAIFDTHEELEKQKPKDKQGEAFVLFANSDIGNLTKRPDVGEPPRNYLEAVYGETPPVQTERTRNFDFRGFCEQKDDKEDPSMEEEGNEWNEMRAVLNHDNMVGLLYIYDPKNDPQQHEEVAKKLSSNFGDEYEMVVFKLRQPGHHQGDMLVVTQENADELKTTMAEMAPLGKNESDDVAEECSKSDKPCRLVTFWELLEKRDKLTEQDKQQDKANSDEQQHKANSDEQSNKRAKISES